MSSSQSVEPRTRRVLLCEDDPLQACGLLRLLDGQDVVAHNVPTVMAALAALQTQEPYDVIISDLTLPGLSGAELARRLRQPLLVAYSGRDGWPRWFDVAITKPDVSALLQVLRRPKLTVVITETAEGVYLGRCHESDLTCRGGSMSHALRILAAAIEVRSLAAAR